MIEVKSLQSHKAHFEERLFERYGLVLAEGEYEYLCDHKNKKFTGIVPKSGNKTIGAVVIKGVVVYVLYYVVDDFRCFPTCYPKDLEYNMLSALRSCFGSILEKIALMIYEEYLNECESLPDFMDEKEAAIYCFNETLFPQLHIEKFKYGTIAPLKVMAQINRIIKGQHPHVKLTVCKRPIEETQILQDKQ